MPYRKRSLTQSERANRLRRAEELVASGVDIVIPRDWRENVSPLEIGIASPCDCLLWNGATGQVYFLMFLEIWTKQPGVTLPDFDLEVAWDAGIVLASFEHLRGKRGSFKSVVEFGGQRYWSEQILNPCIENEERLPRSRTTGGYLLATGLRPIPAEFGERALVPFGLGARDQFSGETLRKVQGTLALHRGRDAQRSQSSFREGLYGGEPRPMTPELESQLRYQALIDERRKQMASAR